MILVEVIIYFIVIALSFFFIPKLNRRIKEIAQNEKLPKKNQKMPRNLGLLATGIFLFLTVSLTFLWLYLRDRFVFSDTNGVYIGSSWVITAVPLLFISIAISVLIAETISLHMKKQKKLGRVIEMERTLRYFLLLFIITFPFIILNTRCYTYVNEDAVYINNFFSVSPIEYKIPDDVKSVDATYWRGSTTRQSMTYYFYYNVTFSDGREIDLFSGNNYEAGNVAKIDKILREDKIQINRETLSEYQIQEIENNFTSPIPSGVKEIYSTQ